MSWYEVWADEGHDVPYILLLRPFSGGFEVLDPAQGNKRVFDSTSYEDAKLYVLEDEFTLVGRNEIED
jgi:hypothetical protein